MKKLLLFIALLIIVSVNSNAQDENNPTNEGSWLIEANTGFSSVGEVGLFQHTANTGFGLTSIDDMTIWSIGSEVGYFVIDDLAMKVGLGYTDLDGESLFSYKIGAKYYVSGNIPFQVDINGASIKDFDENPLWLGLQGGYAFFIGENVSIEPGLRYSLSMNEDFTDEGIFDFRVGFALHF